MSIALADANRVPQVLREMFEEGEAMLGVVVFPYCCGRAEFECSLTPRLCGRHSDAQILVCLEREMFASSSWRR